MHRSQLLIEQPSAKCAMRRAHQGRKGSGHSQDQRVHMIAYMKGIPYKALQKLNKLLLRSIEMRLLDKLPRVPSISSCYKSIHCNPMERILLFRLNKGTVKFRIHSTDNPRNSHISVDS